MQKSALRLVALMLAMLAAAGAEAMSLRTWEPHDQVENARVAARDVFAAGDLVAFEAHRLRIRASAGTENGRELLILTIQGVGSARDGEIRIDLQTGRRVGEWTNVCPTGRTWMTAITGSVRVGVTVNPDGTVLCTILEGLPFGITEATVEAIRSWTFSPQQGPLRGGELEFQFRLLSDAEFAAAQNGVPNRSPF